MNKKELLTLKQAREQRGVSQTLLAKHSTVCQARISLIEREETEATFVETIRLSFALNMLRDEIAWPKMPKKPTVIPEVIAAAEALRKEKSNDEN